MYFRSPTQIPINYYLYIFAQFNCMLARFFYFDMFPPRFVIIIIFHKEKIVLSHLGKWRDILRITVLMHQVCTSFKVKAENREWKQWEVRRPVQLWRIGMQQGASILSVCVFACMHRGSEG